jgi:hypothetical protein
MNYLLETDNSPSKRHGLETIRKHLKEVLYHSTSLTPMLLAKLGMISEQNGKSK